MTKYRALELFCGTKSVGKVLDKHNFDVISVDILKKFQPTIVEDILKLDYKSLPIPDLIWASPPCNSFSTLARTAKTRNWWNLEPTHPNAILGTKILNRTLEIIEYFIEKNPNLLFVIENPKAMMRRMPTINTFPRETTEYSCYGFNYRKPTDFFHNFPDNLHLIEPIGEHKKPQKDLINVAKVPLTQRYKIPERLIETIIQEFEKQYQQTPKTINFEKTIGIEYIKDESKKERIRRLKEFANRNPNLNIGI